MSRRTVQRLLLLVIAAFCAIGAEAQERVKTHCNIFPVPHNGQIGYIDGSGKLVIQPRYDEAGCFRDGRARVVLKGRVGYIDLAGRLIGWAPDVEGWWLFSDGLAAFRDRGNVGYKDRGGSIVIAPKYPFARQFSEGLAAVDAGESGDWARNWGFIDPTGRVAIPFEFLDARSFHEGLAAVTVRGKGVHGLFKQGVIDRSGKLVIAPQAWFIEDDFSEGLVAVETGEKWPQYTRWGYINRKGVWVIPPRFHYGRRFSEGLAAVDFPDEPGSPPRTGYTGYINKLGQTVIPPAFTAACPFENGLAMVHIGRQVGFIDRHGKFLWGPMEEPLYREGPEGDEPWPCPGMAYLHSP